MPKKTKRPRGNPNWRKAAEARRAKGNPDKTERVVNAARAAIKARYSSEWPTRWCELVASVQALDE